MRKKSDPVRLVLTVKEKENILEAVRVWKRSQMSQEVFRAIQQATGIPARLVEVTFWHMDTLALLEQADWLVFKGGTAVQSYLPPSLQRASVDLDFNSRIANPVAVRQAMEELNERLDREGLVVDIKGHPFGRFEFKGEDPGSGVLNYARRMPSRFGEHERVGQYLLQAKSLRVQINYRHAWLPAIEPVVREPAFFILEHQRPDRDVRATHSSIEDLIVDKLLTLTNVSPFGRQRFKDLYDLAMLLRLDQGGGAEPGPASSLTIDLQAAAAPPAASSSVPTASPAPNMSTAGLPACRLPAAPPPIPADLPAPGLPVEACPPPTLSLRRDLVLDKLDLVARKARVSSRALLEGALETMGTFPVNAPEARGFAAMTARDGRRLVREDWEGFCLEARGRLEELVG